MRFRYVLLLGVFAALFAAPVSAATYRSDISGAPGDVLTEGVPFTTDDNGPFVWVMSHTRNTDELYVNAYNEAGHSLAFRFAPPHDSLLRLGRYEAVGYLWHLFSPPNGGMMVRLIAEPGMPDRSCPQDNMTGWFEVKELVRTENGDIITFWIEYSATCRFASVPFHGSVIYNSSHPTPVNSTTWGRIKTLYR